MAKNINAQKKFFRTFFPAMIVFLGLSLFIAFGVEPLHTPQPVVWMLAAAAALALASTFWAHWRFVTEIDEFLRAIQTKAILFGLATVLTIASTWGYFEQYLDAPALPIFYLNPVYWLTFGLAAGVMTKRAGGEI